MKKIIQILTCTIILFTISSCKDSFLDEEILDKYTPESLNDKLGYEAFIVGIHQHFATLHKSADDQTLIGIWHLGTDIAWAPAGRSNGFARPYFDYSALNPSDNASLRVWRYLYKLINNANVLIASAEGEAVNDLTQAEKDAYNAEARFFRSYAYNMLATLYGDVPLVLAPLSSPKTDFVRTPVSEVNKVIEEDLLFAITNLPKIGEAKNNGRANKAMARQLLAEVYLRMGENAKAEEQCTEIINGTSGSVSLVTGRYGVNASKPGDAFSDMFIYGNQRRNQGNTEAIWVLENENPTDKPYTTDSPQQRRLWISGYYDVPGLLPSDSMGGRGIGRIRLNNWVLYNLYEENDMRNSKFNIRREWFFNNTEAKYSNIRGQAVPYGVDQEFVLNDGNKIKILATDTIWRMAPYSTKWAQFDSRDTFGFGMWKDYILMRLGETYLLRAEARFKQNNLSRAADDINVLRKRANASIINNSGEVTLDLILDERARELLGEENRRMTLVRTDQLKERIEKLNGTAPLAGGNIETTNAFQSHNVLMPIPQIEIDLNKDAKLDQNPGYN